MTVLCSVIKHAMNDGNASKEIQARKEKVKPKGFEKTEHQLYLYIITAWC